jgi:hypothetical protein
MNKFATKFKECIANLIFSTQVLKTIQFMTESIKLIYYWWQDFALEDKPTPKVL